MSDITLIMCSWNRPWYIKHMIESYEKQTVKPKEFIIWNNNLKLKKELNKTCKGHDVNLYHHDKNVGGFGRFYAARDMAKTEYVLFIDDDWKMFPNHVEHLNERKKPDAIVGTWAWKYGKYRGGRQRIESGEAHYAGTCGQISPRKLYDNAGLYTCPEKYWFIEDLWQCWYSRHELNYKVMSAGKLESIAKNMNRDDKGRLIEKVPGLSAKLMRHKPGFVKYLTKRFGK
jgi:hypothetical protein